MGWLGSFFGSGQKGSSGAVRAMDAVTYVASLASDPRQIDSLLDPMRKITSELKPGETLSPADQRQLAAVYKDLENHLLHNESLRVFDKQELQDRINRRFPDHLADEAEFWNSIQDTKVKKA